MSPCVKARLSVCIPYLQNFPELQLQTFVDVGNRVSCARCLIFGSFMVNFSMQAYGMLTRPSMKFVADSVRHSLVFECGGKFT